MTKKKLVLTVLTAALVGVFGGCGPQDLNDADYLTQMNEAGLDAEGQVLSKDDEAEDDEEPAPARLAGKLAPRHIRYPGVVEKQDPIIINTAEDRNYEQEIHHWKTTYRPQAEITNHTINNILTKRHIHHHKIVNQPSKCTKVFHTNRTVEVSEVTPTEEVTMPVTQCGVARTCSRFWPGYYGAYRRW